ncbi:MAG: biopolymer transporter ExbD [Myxococcota bacterium]
MPIKKPVPHLGTTVALQNVKKAMSKGHKSVYAELNLTPMIDMFTMIVIFLLMTFSASGEIAFVTRDIKLPEAQQFAQLESAPVIAVSSPESDPRGGVVTLDGSEVATVRELVESESPDFKISRLSEDLEVLKHNCKLLNPDDADQICTQVIVQSDRKIEFKVLKKIMYSSGLAGYGNVNFAVNQKAASGGGKGGHP